MGYLLHKLSNVYLLLVLKIKVDSFTWEGAEEDIGELGDGKLEPEYKYEIKSIINIRRIENKNSYIHNRFHNHYV